MSGPFKLKAIFLYLKVMCILFQTHAQVDVVYLVDSSTSISPSSFSLIRQTLIKITSQLSYIPRTRQAIVQYGDNEFHNPSWTYDKYYNTVVKLGQCSKIQCLHDLIEKNMVLMNSSNTYTAEAIQRVMEVDFADSASITKKFLILCTDGIVPTDEKRLTYSFNLTRNSNVTVFMLGFGENRNESLHALVANQNLQTNQVFVDGSASVSKLVEEIHKIVCPFSQHNKILTTEQNLSVTLNGTFNSKIGDKLRFTCTHNSCTQHNESLTQYSLGNEQFSYSKNLEYFEVNAKREDNGKEIFCRITWNQNDTQGNPIPGSSKRHYLNITYPPILLNATNVFLCEWFEGMPGNCSASFEANPPPDKVIFKSKESNEVVFMRQLKSMHFHATIEKQTKGPYWNVRFFTEKAVMSDGGRYEIVLVSSVFMENPLILSFQVVIKTTLVETERFPIWIPILVVAICVVVAAITAVFWHKTRKCKNFVVNGRRHKTTREQNCVIAYTIVEEIPPQNVEPTNTEADETEDDVDEHGSLTFIGAS